MHTKADIERRIAELIETRRSEQVRFLAELVKVPSDNPPGDCQPHALKAAALLTDLGLEVERYDVPADVVKRNGMQSATNLIVRHTFGPGPTVALNAHGDVVPPGEGWTTDPYGAEIRDGRMYGRGVAVSKSDFATYAYALKALIDSGATLNGTVELHFTYDEEIGGHVGPGWLLEQGLTRPDFAIAASFSYYVVVAHNGCLHLEVQVDGRSAHAAMPDSGADALEAATKLLSSLYAYRKEFKAVRSESPGLDHPTLVIGLISGGINTNVVPDRVTFRLDRRILPDEDISTAETSLVAHIDACARTLPNVKVSTRRILLAQPLRPSEKQRHLVEIVQYRAQAILKEDIPALGVPLFTDARLYSEAGAATIMYGAGPRSILEANGHRADENIKLDDLHKATEIVALSLLDLLG
jgi:acetylornithine deacetylase/succinyl-diaminopimelate desuccinylase family protein